MRSHCIRGHELTPDNAVISADGRRCRTCRRMARERRSEQQKAANAKKRAEYNQRNYMSIDAGIRAVNIIASRPPAHLIAEAQRRADAPHRDLTGLLQGDPPIGQSALDRGQSA